MRMLSATAGIGSSPKRVEMHAKEFVGSANISFVLVSLLIL